MPMYLLEGLQGSGKSLHIMEWFIIPELRKGRKIFHNLPLNETEIEIGENLLCTSSQLLFPIDADFIQNLLVHLNELAGSVLVIDETQNYFISSKAMVREDLVDFFSTHRHNHMDIVMATQDKANINKVIRNLASSVWHFEKFTQFGANNTYKIDFFLPGKTKRYKRTFGKFDKKYFPYYDSYNKKSSVAGYIEEPIGVKDRSLQTIVFIAVVALIISIFVFKKVITRQAYASEVVDVDKSLEVEEKVVSALKQEKVSSGKVVVINLKGDRVEVSSSAKSTGLVKVGDKYRTIIKDGNKTIIAKSYKLLPFERKVYSKASDFIKDHPPRSSFPQRGREGGIFSNVVGVKGARFVNGIFNSGSKLDSEK